MSSELLCPGKSGVSCIGEDCKYHTYYDKKHHFVYCSVYRENIELSPHVYLKPKTYIDGDQWCALLGEDLQSGIAGFGNTELEALAEFDKNYNDLKGQE